MCSYFEFINVLSIDDLIEKRAELNVLLSSISVVGSDLYVYPVRCPAIGRATDILLDKKNEPACCFQRSKCKYFDRANFKLDAYTKEIICRFGESS